jgi:hypothetical protein
LAKSLGWSTRKVDYALKELIERRLVSRVRNEEASGYRLEEGGAVPPSTKIKVKEPPAAQELVTLFIKLRLSGQTIAPPMWRRLIGEAARALKTFELEELKSCIEWLHTEKWWSKQTWSLSAVASTGMIQYRRWKQRQQRVPGEVEQKSEKPTLGFVSMVPKKYR